MSDGGTPAASRPLAGRRGWIITDDKAGMVVQARGVADALGLVTEWKLVAPTGLARFMAPWGPVDRKDSFGAPGSQFAPPWPAVAIATGRLSIPYVRALRRHAGLATYTVVLQDPKTGPKTADLIWVPAHDRRRGANVITTLVPPHSFSARRLAELRADVPAAIAALPSPRITVVLGGKNGVYRFTDEDDDRLEGAIRSLAALGASFLVTPSRRTHKRLVAAVARATEGAPRILWDGTGTNPYPDFLAHGDAFVVTADSVNMTGEACASGRPVYVFFPSGGSAKFSRFHDELARHGATRPLPPALNTLESWDYEALNSADTIASEIERRWSARSRMIPGLVEPQGRPA